MRVLLNSRFSMYLIVMVSLFAMMKTVFQTHVLAQAPVQLQNQIVIVVLKDQPQIQTAQDVKAEYQPRLNTLTQKLETLSVRIDGIASTQPTTLTRAEEIALAKQRSVVGRQVLTPDQAAYQQTLSDIDAMTSEMRREIVARSTPARDASQATVAQYVTDLGGSVIYYYETINAMAVSIPPDKRAELAAHPDVASVENDQVMTANMDVSAVAIGADTWWNNGYTGGAWDVAILDSGIDHTHPALSSQTYIEKRCLDTAAYYGDGANDPTADDVNGHGTHVAGTVASTDATYKGIAYGLDVLMNAKAAYDGDGADGGPASMYYTDAMACVDWALNNEMDDADIINYSYGSVATVDDGGFERFWDAVVAQMDAVVSISAGNFNVDGTPTIGSPSIAYNVISVANVDDKNTTNRADDTIASTSSRGPTPGGRKKPDLAAPGTNIMSTNNTWEGPESDFVSYSGTSMASPHIAGAATLLMDAGITDPKAIKALMINTAEDKGVTGWDAEYGWGYLDLNHLDFHKTDYFNSSISASPAYHFYAGPAYPNDTATLVWNRRAVYTGTYPSTYYNLTDLDLNLYDENTNAQLDSSTSGIDNVEQVKASETYTSVVIKVDSYSSNLDGTTLEPYALATEENFAYKTGPALNIVVTNTSGDPAGPMNTIISVSAYVENSGDLDAHDVQMFLTHSSGLTEINGGGINIGTLEKGNSSSAHTFQFRKTDYQPQTITIQAASSSYGETFNAAPHTISGTLNDTCYAKVASTGTIYHFVQEAVNNAADGDTVKVAGTCTGVEYRGGISQTVYISKTVTLQGGYTTNNWTSPDPVANSTTLDAQGLGRVMYITGNISPTIAGLHINGGYAEEGAGIYARDVDGITISENTIEGNDAADWFTVFVGYLGTGGGIYLDHSNSTLHDNIILGNKADSGGGIYLLYGNANLYDNVIQENSIPTYGCGGGVYVVGAGNTVFNNNLIDLNQVNSGVGGGICVNGNVTLYANSINHNQVIHGNGGGIYIGGGASSVFNENYIFDNRAVYGGGAYIYRDSSALNRNYIRQNTASSDLGVYGSGGGVYIDESNDTTLNSNYIIDNSAITNGGGVGLSNSSPRLINTVFVNNQAGEYGGGLYVYGSNPSLYNTTFVHNVGGGDSAVYITHQPEDYMIPEIYSDATLINTIIASHTVGITVTAGSTVTLDSTLWYGNSQNTGGAGSITTNNDYTGDPAFDTDGYHLTMRSAAINKGVSTSSVTDDIDGDTRPQGTAPDLGADEAIIPTLSIAETAQLPSGTIDPGDTVIYNIVVTNNGDLEAPDVHITDPLPAGLSGNSLDVTVDIPAGQSLQYSVNATVDEGTKGQDIVNYAYFSHPIIGNGSAQTTFTVNPIYTVYLPVILK